MKVLWRLSKKSYEEKLFTSKGDDLEFKKHYCYESCTFKMS